ncbi:hypothetical protein CYLTODRAFT_490921 [Cylindrobasidium torrendii FP15055 ss-10]|uniref:Protein kinase domain-containing protein n=1 Tax=Cylindrobasidium torrendii FP15055 ss-10 TaxID=1314674 RepID=A0A0D7B920_9AGAR|nr:hypothetical protein CYLTODRAFT_490921 [Cylindrobasidium torrendii FP15055 ss-10]
MNEDKRHDYCDRGSANARLAAKAVAYSNDQGFLLDLPFGSWPHDLCISIEDKQTVFGKELARGNGACVIVLASKPFVVKFFIMAADGTPIDDRLHRELDMSFRAGTDCAVEIVGRFYWHGRDYPNGFVMPLEEPFHPGTISPDKRLYYIDELCALIERLHSRGVVHGDLKPSNLLVQPDGFRAHQLSDPYASPARTRDFLNADFPPSREDDLWALALCVWAIYVGDNDSYKAGLSSNVQTEEPDEYEDLVWDAAYIGMRPDMARVDDPRVRSLITEFLDTEIAAGLDEPYFPILQMRMICVEAEVRMGECKADPQHTKAIVEHCVESDKNYTDERPEDMTALKDFYLLWKSHGVVVEEDWLRWVSKEDIHPMIDEYEFIYHILPSPLQRRRTRILADASHPMAR